MDHLDHHPERHCPQIQFGGPAACQVYNTYELRRAIYGYFDHKALVEMFTLHEDGMACVAGIIHGKVHPSRVQKLNRKINVSSQ
jgi:hypothetical protein